MTIENNGTRLLWWVLGVFATLSASGVVFVGSALYSLNARLASVEAKLEIMLAERVSGKTYRGVDQRAER